MEIGGEFESEIVKDESSTNKKFFLFGKMNEFVMSGRTAIDIAIQDCLILMHVNL